MWFVNSIVWDGNIVNWTPGWCDVCECLSFPDHFGVGRRVEIRLCASCSHEDCDRDDHRDPRFDVGHSEEDVLHG